MSTKVKFVLLCILDGWGLAPDGPGNAIALAKTPNIDSFFATFPHTQLNASGEAVGLPRGEVGNTETGHLNLGAGRIVYQDLARINMSVADGTFFQNKVILDAITHAKEKNSNLHIMGLVGAGGVHSSLDHLFSILQICKQQNFNNVFIHAFTDGRDSPPTAAKDYLASIANETSQLGVGKIASVMGRYWAMDRDFRWERTQKAYMALTQAQGNLVKTPQEAVEMSYQQGKTDEFIEPSIITDSKGVPLAIIKDNDSIIFFNFRIDRPRQLTKAFLLDDFSQAYQDVNFDPFTVKYTKKHKQDPKYINTAPMVRFKKLEGLHFVTMTEYSKLITSSGAHVAFPPELISMPLGRIISEARLNQLRVAESEKERFVTFYFNGLQEIVFPGEDHLIVPSPQVPTYDLKPEMSSFEMTDILLKKLVTNNYYSLIVMNIASADMVGHTGNLQAAIKACEAVDECVGKIANFVLAHEGALLITADHGNVEEMIKIESGDVDTEHSDNPVPFIIVSEAFRGKSANLPVGKLGDVATTILPLLGLQPPSSMPGVNLLESIKI
jgi:2,3-bisphosphoglycerate-independent phosphoglycerate mutase